MRVYDYFLSYNDMQVMVSKIGLTMTRNDLQKAIIIITSNKIAL